MKTRILSVCLILVLLCSVFVGCSTSDESAAGEKHIVLQIVANGETTEKEADTTQTTLLGLLEEMNLVEGESSSVGYTVRAINGIEADMEKNIWWIITKDGQWTDSVEKVNIADGDTYVFTLTQY